jgi:hypothetical protein
MCSFREPAQELFFLYGRGFHMGRRLSMLSMSESVELRPFPLSLTRSLMRMPGLLAG